MFQQEFLLRVMCISLATKEQVSMVHITTREHGDDPDQDSHLDYLDVQRMCRTGSHTPLASVF